MERDTACSSPTAVGSDAGLGEVGEDLVLAGSTPNTDDDDEIRSIDGDVGEESGSEAGSDINSVDGDDGEMEERWVPSNTVWLDEGIHSEVLEPVRKMQITAKRCHVQRVERIKGGLPSYFPIPQENRLIADHEQESWYGAIGKSDNKPQLPIFTGTIAVVIANTLDPDAFCDLVEAQINSHVQEARTVEQRTTIGKHWCLPLKGQQRKVLPWNTNHEKICQVDALPSLKPTVAAPPTPQPQNLTPTNPPPYSFMQNPNPPQNTPLLASPAGFGLPQAGRSSRSDPATPKDQPFGQPSHLLRNIAGTPVNTVNPLTPSSSKTVPATPKLSAPPISTLPTTVSPATTQKRAHAFLLPPKSTTPTPNAVSMASLAPSSPIAVTFSPMADQDDQLYQTQSVWERSLGNNQAPLASSSKAQGKKRARPESDFDVGPMSDDPPLEPPKTAGAAESDFRVIKKPKLVEETSEDNANVNGSHDESSEPGPEPKTSKSKKAKKGSKKKSAAKPTTPAVHRQQQECYRNATFTGLAWSKDLQLPVIDNAEAFKHFETSLVQITPVPQSHTSESQTFRASKIDIPDGFILSSELPGFISIDILKKMNFITFPFTAHP
ncbi:hypothetical protein K435DRAFT_853462 [Dendrothele bispora CBS 962.96]|uniref:Uncharacterized protein n=1 Tax=Dendrothele bispora (strain CBS 962.96) TaxID=1314807 RepID=A0A4S8MGU7_DENBC|nr:hypothetical protein K435DRAFT_853462 [Dendrothele bispora CBS 962.96]